MRLLIAVKSCQKDKRDGVHQAIRETWGKSLPKNVDLLFFVGGESAPTSLEKDEIYLLVKDGYWDTSFKTTVIIRYVVQKDYDFYCLCDTDAYFEFSKLMSSGFERYDYSGGPTGGGLYFGVPYAGLYISEYNNLFIAPFYRFMSGHAYILSRRALKIAVSSPSDHPAMPEDLMIGQILGPFIGSGELTAKVLPGNVAIHLNCGYSGGGMIAQHPKCQYDHSIPIPRRDVVTALRKKHQELTGQEII